MPLAENGYNRVASRMMRVHTRSMGVSYAEVLARNVRAARSRAGLELEPVAAHMRALGQSAWRRQTVSAVERGKRRLTAVEAYALAIALRTTVMNLRSPKPDDQSVELPGSTLPALPVVIASSIVAGENLGWVTWPADDKAAFNERPDSDVLGTWGHDVRGRLR